MLVWSFACSTTESIRRPLSTERLEDVERLLSDQQAVVTYVPRAGVQMKDAASEVVVAPEKVRWVRWESEFARSRGSPPEQVVEVPIDAVRKISICEPGCHGRGALEGVGVGFLVGLGVSGILAAGCSPSRDIGNFCPFLWIPGPVLGMLLGALIGSRGHPTILEFEAPSAGK
jgi:hypothetical protein